VSEYRGRGRASGRHRGRWWLIAVVILIVLLVGLDFAARAVAEQVTASQIEQQASLAKKPDVSIEGFPFLTQVAAKKFDDVKIGISDLQAGPVLINSIDATATDIKLSSFNFQGGTIGRVHGTLLINFASVGKTLTTEIGPLGTLLDGAGLSVSDAGRDEIRASLNLVVTSGSATWRVTRVSADELNIRLVSSSGVPSSVLGSMQNVNVQIPKLPLGLSLDSVSVTPAGVVGSISGSNVPFGNS
jgi:LmeA-like phospholipid-binding